MRTCPGIAIVCETTEIAMLRPGKFERTIALPVNIAADNAMDGLVVGAVGRVEWWWSCHIWISIKGH